MLLVLLHQQVHRLLGDWQDESTETGVSSWSDKAQVYLYCAAEGSNLRLTMTNLSGMERG